ncbi:hypothetical protein FDECE_3777 [Fusarium decemcellulare]|nr:hypothetical protein FDECE_3777 [Fusarium decemcellulare]
MEIPRPRSALRDAFLQRGLDCLGREGGGRMAAEHVIALKKARSKSLGSFRIVDGPPYRGIDEYRELLESGDIIIILADAKGRDQPPEELLIDLFHIFNLPVWDYLDMIASFFQTQPSDQISRLRPTTYPESATDLRFLSSYTIPTPDIDPTTPMLPDLCYKIYIVDANHRSGLTVIDHALDSSAPPLVRVPKIHKCAVFVKPVPDQLIVTTTDRSLSDRIRGISYPLNDSSGEAVAVSAAQYILAESGSSGWETCLNSIEGALEELLQKVINANSS